MLAIERLRRIHNPNSLPYVCEMYLPEKQRFDSAGQRPPGNLPIVRLFGNVSSPAEVENALTSVGIVN
jgi:hypothetical protein